MVDVKKSIKSALETATNLSVYYELFTKSVNEPCITYIESGSSDSLNSDVLVYSDISYTVKIWAEDIETIMTKSLLVDDAMRGLGFKRSGSNEVAINSTICKILNYDAVGQEGSKAWY